MFDQLPLSAVARLLRPILGAVATRVRSLHAERQARVKPFGQPTDLAEKILSNTLNRLRGGNIDDAWWRNLLNSIGQQFITPEFLKKRALQEWLGEVETADDLKVLAKGRIRGGDHNYSGVRERLAQSYSRRTGEAPSSADEAIDVVVAVLVAGYIASVPSPQRPVVGLVQNLSGHIDKRFDHLEESLRQATTDPTTQRTHTEKTDQELQQILILRTLDPLRARQNIQELQGRVGDEGDLSAASVSTKKGVLYWTARLYAGDAETLADTRQLRNELRQTDPDMDLSIVEALLAEADGDENGALLLLRDHDDPDSRTVLFGVLVRSRGERAALAWYADETTPDDGQFFTDVGWRNWAVCMAKVGKWKEAAQRLHGFESYWQTMPALALVEGVINAAMLLPTDHRERALYVVPIYQDVTPNLVTEAENYHSRAATCFEFAEQSLRDIADHNLARFIADWRLWIRLMAPNTANGNIVRDEICKRMESGAEAVNLMQFAWAFDIPADLKPLRGHLEHRKQLGGLNDNELLAECLLSEKSMKPRDFVSYLEQHSTRLVEIMPVDSVTAMHIEALVRDGQTERARTIAEGRAADLGEAQSNRLNVLIDAHEGNDPRKQLELLYRQTNDLIDLKNLVSYLKRVEDRTALRPLIRDLFGRERTVENAQDLVKCFAGSSFFDYKAIIDFLEENPDILGRSDDLKAVKAWALFQAGRLKDSKEINDIQLSRRVNQDDIHLDVNIALSAGDWGRVPAIVDREWSRRGHMTLKHS